MNKLFSVALLPAFALLFAILPERNEVPGNTVATAADSAIVYFYRGPQFAMALTNFVLRANGREICRLSGKRYMVYKTLPGKIAFGSDQGGAIIKKREELELDLEAGKYYYVQCDIKTGFATTRMEMTEVTEGTAKKKMDGLLPDNCMNR